MKQIRKVFAATTKAADEDRALIVTISTPTPDRSGDIVEPHGGDLSHYKRNPVVLFGHNYKDLPIARADDIQVTDQGIVARVVFPTQGTYERADAVYGLAKQGMINAWSIGFGAKQADTEPLDDGGVKFNKWQLLEFSAVPVPDNPEALTILRSKGIHEEVIDEVTTEDGVEDGDEEEELEDSNIEEVEDEQKSLEIAPVTRKDVDTALERIKFELKSIEALIEAITTEEPQPTEEKSSTQQDHHMVLTYEQALKAADKIIGMGLRNAKRPKKAS